MKLSEYIGNLKGKKVDVIGIGVSNTPVVRMLRREGIQVTARDRRTKEQLGDAAEEIGRTGAKLVLGEGYLDNLDTDVIFRSPGVRPDEGGIPDAVKNGAILTSEMEAFFEVCPCRITAVTGSDGKTTTTTIISEILMKSGKRVHVGGNIGVPLLESVDSIAEDDICVIELSSFQLLTMKKSPDVAVVTNIAPNHLDVHRNMDEYINAKRNIFVHVPQPERVVLNADNDVTASFAGDVRGEVSMFSARKRVHNGTYLSEGEIISSENGAESVIMPESDILLPGKHNVENYMAAFAALAGEVGHDAMAETARSFRGVEHRLEFVRELNGIKFYNDSIASSPSRTAAGLRSFDRKVILIAGGKEKGVPFDSLGENICRYAKELVLTGQASDKIEKAVLDAGGALPILKCADLVEAVRTAYDTAESGDVILLSPACTSFDMFRNFEERGMVFKNVVRELG